MWMHTCKLYSYPVAMETLFYNNWGRDVQREVLQCLTLYSSEKFVLKSFGILFNSFMIQAKTKNVLLYNMVL